MSRHSRSRRDDNRKEREQLGKVREMVGKLSALEGDEAEEARRQYHDAMKAMLGGKDPNYHLTQSGWQSMSDLPVEPGRVARLGNTPGAVTGLTHRWEHPAFRPRDTAPPPLAVMDKEARRDAFLRAIAASPEDEGPHLEYADWLYEQGEDDAARRHREWKAERQKAWDWLHAFAERWNFDFEQMMALAQLTPYGHDQEYVVARGVDLHGAGELGDDLKTFWECVEVVTGREYAPEERERLGWSCTC